MSARANRSGAPETPTTTTAGTPGSVAEVRTFSKYARPCVIANGHATEALFVKVNLATVTASDFHVKILAGTATDVSFGGIVNVTLVGLWYPSVAFSNAFVAGWLP